MIYFFQNIYRMQRLKKKKCHSDNNEDCCKLSTLSRMALIILVYLSKCNLLIEFI